jgi:hypothetical protein
MPQRRFPPSGLSTLRIAVNTAKLPELLTR